MDKAKPIATSGAKTQTRTPKMRARVLPIADSYLLWSVFGASLRGLGWFAGLFLAFATVSGVQKIAERGVPFLVGMEAIALQIPRILLFTIPTSLLFGAVSTFTEMSAKGEVSALSAGGMSLQRMLRAPIILSVALGLFAFWLQESVVPGAELRKGMMLERAIYGAKRVEDFVYMDTRPNKSIERVIQADLFDPATRTLQNPTIQIFGPQNTVEQEIKAQSAFYDEKRGVMIFKNGFSRTNPTKANRLGSSITNSFSVLSIETKFEQLKKGEKGAREQIKSYNFEMVSWQQLAQYRAEQHQLFTQAKGKIRRDARREVRAATFGIHDKWAMPFVIIGMMLVGAPLGVRPQRTATPGLAMGLSLMVMLGYYIFWTICTQAGKGGIALPHIVAYLPAVTLWITGLVLLKKRS